MTPLLSSFEFMTADPFLSLPIHYAILSGSGTVTILEAYRGLIAADFRPVQNVEFHWYAAEVWSGFPTHLRLSPAVVLALQSGSLLCIVFTSAGGWASGISSCSLCIREGWRERPCSDTGLPIFSCARVTVRFLTASTQFDMTAWVANGSEEVIGIYRKFVDDE